MPKKTPVLNKPRPLKKGEAGYGKKRKVVYVKNPATGKVKTIKFGDAKLGMKKGIPARKKSYCARSSGQKNTKNKLSANYWARKDWGC
jgi:hypothetical protein